jgi:hypothetical protein
MVGVAPNSKLLRGGRKKIKMREEGGCENEKAERKHTPKPTSKHKFNQSQVSIRAYVESNRQTRRLAQ